MAVILGIDIGTTNIEYILSDSTSNDINRFIERNPLTQYGLDVMTRITKANNGLLNDMSQRLRQNLQTTISRMINAHQAPDIIKIAANTTMVHMLMNYDCTNLGSFPFSPVHTERIQISAQEINISQTDIPVIITPGFSAFVGGDIVSGIQILPDNNYLFIDLGTNAEMVLADGDEIYTTSAAAGPAFETCSYGHATDAVDGLVHMLNKGIMDETGLLEDEYFDSGYDCNGLHFSQKKIRDFQMAKSAIRTGIDLLIKAVYKDADISSMDFTIYIAGTFGLNLNIENAIRLGMFPEWFSCRCNVIGNSSLAGALIENENYSILQKKIREIVLANLPDFNDFYINNMNFE